MASERIFAVDPGKVTGWCFYETGSPSSFTADEAEHMEFLALARRVIELGRCDTVVCEDFIITVNTVRKTQGQLWSLEQRGVLRYLAHEHGVNFKLQRPADAKRFATDKKLRAAGWYRPTAGGHQNDAARHLLTYLASSGQLEDILAVLRSGEPGESTFGSSGRTEVNIWQLAVLAVLWYSSG